MAAISLHGVRRVHPDGTDALSGVDLDVVDGELLGVIGPSGAGKSTLLRVIAGLEPLSDGQVTFDGRDVAALTTQAREVALISQGRGLYSFLDVAANLAFPLRLRHTDPDEIDRRTGAERQAFGLDRVWHRRPRQLSAGDAQRTALARAMVRVPQVLLADEPLQLLDPPTTARMRAALHDLQRASAMTTVWTTNDHPQVLGIADRVAVLHDGRILQVDAPEVLLTRPASLAVAAFAGEPPMAFVEVGLVDEGGVGRVLVGEQSLRFPGGLPGPLRQRATARVMLGGRPGVVRAVRPEDPVDTRVSGVVVAVHGLGHADHVVLDVPSGRLVATFPPGSRAAIGQPAEAHLDLRRMSAFDPSTGSAVWHGG